MKSWGKYLPIFLVCVGGVIAFVPWMLKNGIFHTIIISTDLASHAGVVEAVGNGVTPQPMMYPAEYIVGYPLGLIQRLTGIDATTLFLTFSFLSLIAVGITLYFVFSRLAGKLTGYLTVLVAMLCTQCILAFFSYGTVFNMINIYIILPWIMFFAIRWLTGNKAKYLIATVLLCVFHSIFHPTAFYLALAVGLLAVVLLVAQTARWIRRRRFGDPRPLLLCTGLLGTGVLSLWLFFHGFWKLIGDVFRSVAVGGGGYSIYTPLSFGNFVENFLEPITAVLAVIAVAGLILYRKTLSFKPEVKMMLVILGSLAVVLCVGTFTSLTADPVRMALDFGSILAIMVAVVIGILLEKKEHMWLPAGCYCIMACGAMITLLPWLTRTGAV